MAARTRRPSGGAFPVQRGRRDATAFETAVGLVRAGGIVVVFPEGTRRQKGGRKRPPEVGTGAARIAFRGGVPLVPAAISGTDNLLGLSPIRVVFGHPVDVEDLRHQGIHERARIATERLVETIERLRTTL